MKILIADDHGIVRGGLRLLIDRQPDMEVIAEAEDGVDAFEQALQTQPDLCVMDVSMPRMTGLQAARQIKSHRVGSSGRLGVSGMRERALLVGGNLSIFSEEGEGTTVELTMGGR